jgi:ATP-dependent helicase/nuclease subunit B
MLLEGGLGEAGADRTIRDYVYLRLSGGAPAGEEKALALGDASEIAREVYARLKGVIDRFEDEDQPYLSSASPRAGARFEGDYDHLARIKEWSKSGGEPEEEAPPP